jgi:5'-phosphate synthase pdxT subunit
MKAGVVAIQGDVSEHISSLQSAIDKCCSGGHAVAVRSVNDLESVDRLVIPGGESTTISKLLVRFGLFDRVVKRAEEGMPLMGTCAGCILMARKGDEQVGKTGTKLLSLMDMKVDRNFFGRQRESFEAHLSIDGVSKDFTGIFIRAPAITEVWGSCRSLSTLGDKIVMAQQGSMLALAFHPELSGSTEIHEKFLSL